MFRITVTAVALLAFGLAIGGLAIGGLAIGGMAVGGTAAPTAAVGDAPIVAQEVDADDVYMSVDVEADGDAAWTIEYRTRLATDTDEEAFEEFRADLESDPAEYQQRFHDRMNTTAEEAAAATGREMAITDVTVSAERRELPQEYGVVTYQFRWSNFAATDADSDEFVVGDAIDGLFLDDATTLSISWPAGYTLEAATPEPHDTRDRAVSWSGPITFGQGEPRMAVSPTSSGGVGGAFPVSPGVLVAVALVLAAGTATAIVYRRRSTGDAVGATATGAGGDGNAAGIADEPADAETSAASSAADDSDGEDRHGDQAAPIDPELLSNQEQVIRVLEAHGGRMKQQQVAEQLDWTDAKTSQVTTEMRSEGEIDGFRLGRENVLTLPDVGVGPVDGDGDRSGDGDQSGDGNGDDPIDN